MLGVPAISEQREIFLKAYPKIGLVDGAREFMAGFDRADVDVEQLCPFVIARIASIKASISSRFVSPTGEPQG